MLNYIYTYGVYYFGAAVVFVFILLAIHGEKASAEADARYEEKRREEDARPWLVVSVNGETALVERWDGRRFDVTNAFPELRAGMFVALDYRGNTIEDYFM